MNEQKRKRFEETLTKAFDHDRYVQFLKELLDNMQIVAPNKVIKPYSTFSAAIDHYKHIGNYTGEDKSKVALFSVCLKNDKNLENARSMQRAFVKTLLENSNCAGALVAFYTADDLDKWRLSLVRMDYEFSKGKLSARLTPAKRYSYLVGDGEPCHTAQERLYPIFVADNFDPSLDELEEAFSVEAVTKDFFDQYREKYLDLKEFLDSNPEFTAEAESRGFDSEQFAKKLMGQIVFLYFIQKKGWLGVNAFPFKLTEREYKSAFYRSGRKPKELMPYVYKQMADGLFYRDNNALLSLSPEDETLLSTLVKGDAWGDGPKDFMRQIFNGCKSAGKNFFDDYLEPLFYTGLNQNRGDNAFFSPLHRRIPFLNGGLFEEMEGYDWRNNDFCIPNDLFSNADEKGRDADGILDVFDRFNFTMAEDEPMEREVAIDPEMLGKVFENLLDVTDRKSKGAFYTPREIVHYMCQESLINYLAARTRIAEEDIRKFILYGEYFRDEDTKKTIFVKGENGAKGHMEFDYEKDMEIPESLFSYKKNVNRLQEVDNLLANVKVVDLAVGSGAFPLGMLTEIVKARDTITSYMTIDMNGYQRLSCRSMRNSYRLKRETIKNSIFACDIEASATDITKLRLWLSLVIDNQIMDQENDEFGYTTKPRELPNLDCNIICGNSLLDEFYGIPLITQSAVLGNDQGRQMTTYDEQIGIMLQQLIELQSRLYDEKDHVAKDALKSQIQDIYNSIVVEQLKVNPKAEDAYYQAIQLPSKPFVLWQLYFPKVFKDNGGFDIAIGNPPYIGEEGHKELFRPVAETSFGKEYYMGKMDFWYFFTSKALTILRTDGFLSFIAPNNWMTTAGGKKMRSHIAKSAKIIRFITFNNVMIFETASQQTMIFLLRKRAMTQAYKLEYKAIGNRQLNASELNTYLFDNSIGEHYLTSYDPINNYDGKTIQFLNESISDVIDKIRDGNRIYLQNNEILNGIHPHHAEVTKKMLAILPSANVGDGIFILSNSEIERMNIPESERVLLHPYYDSTSIGRYYFDPSVKKQIIYTTSDFKNTSLMNTYPVIKKHLDRYVEVITSDNRPYGLHRARKQEFFENPKICSLRKCAIPTFSYIDRPAYVTAEWYLIMTDRVDMRYLTVLLNSALIKFWLLKMGKIQGNIYQVDKDPLVKIPILKPDGELSSIIADIHNNIAQKRFDGKDTSDLEKKADSLIFEAYGLDNRDIAIVEQTIAAWENKQK